MLITGHSWEFKIFPYERLIVILGSFMGLFGLPEHPITPEQSLQLSHIFLLVQMPGDTGGHHRHHDWRPRQRKMCDHFRHQRSTGG